MKTMTLEEAFRKGIVKKGNYIDYPLTVATCILDESQTGCEYNQTFSTEALGWKLYELNGKLILLADRPTRQKLTLRGKMGYEKGVEVQHKLCRDLYTNSLFALKVISITEEIVEKICIILERSYWLASPYVRSYRGSIYHLGMYGSGGRINELWSYGSYFGSICSDGILPVVYLKPDVQIIEYQNAGDKRNPWVIIPGNELADNETLSEEGNISKTKTELMQLVSKGEQLIEEGNVRIKEGKAMIEKVNELLNKL